MTVRPGVLLLLGFFTLGGCQREPEPVTVAKAFAAAIQQRSAKGVLLLLDARTQNHIQQAAERATDQIGGRRQVGAYEMLQVVDVDPRFQVAQATLLASDDTEATVRLDGVDGSGHVLTLVLEEGEWHVQVPRPPARHP